MSDISSQYPEIPAAADLLDKAKCTGGMIDQYRFRTLGESIVKLADTLSAQAPTDTKAAEQYLALTETRAHDQRPSLVSAIVHCVLTGMIKARVGCLEADDDPTTLTPLAMLVDMCNMVLTEAASLRRRRTLYKDQTDNTDGDNAAWESVPEQTVLGSCRFCTRDKSHVRPAHALMLVRLGVAHHVLQRLRFRDNVVEALAPSKGNKSLFHHMASAHHVSEESCLEVMLIVARARLGKDLVGDDAPTVPSKLKDADLALLKQAGLCSRTNIDGYSALNMAVIHNNVTYAKVLLTIYPDFASMVDSEKRTPLLQLAYQCCKHGGSRARQELARVLVLGGVDPFAVDSAGNTLAELHSGYHRQLGPLVQMVNATMRVRARASILANAYMGEKVRARDGRSIYGPKHNAARAFTHIAVPTLSKPTHATSEKSLAVDYGWLWACTDPQDTLMETTESALMASVAEKEAALKTCEDDEKTDTTEPEAMETEAAGDESEEKDTVDPATQPVLSAARRALEVDREALELVQEAREARRLEKDSRENVLERFTLVDGGERPMAGVDCVGSGMQIGDDTYVFTLQFQGLGGAVPPPSVIQMRLRLVDEIERMRTEFDSVAATRAPSNSPACAAAEPAESKTSEEAQGIPSAIHAALVDVLGVEDVVFEDNDTDDDEGLGEETKAPGTVPLPPLKLPRADFASLEHAFNTLPDHKLLRGSYITVECDWASLLFASGAYEEQLSRMIADVTENGDRAHAEGVHHVLPLENCDPAEQAYFHRRHVDYSKAGEFLRSTIPDDIHNEYDVACAYQFNLVPALMATEDETRAAFRSLKRNLTTDAAISVAQSVADGTVHVPIDEADKKSDEDVPLDKALELLKGTKTAEPDADEERLSTSEAIKQRLSEWEQRINASIATKSGQNPADAAGVATVGGEPVDGFLWFMFPNLTITFSFRRRSTCEADAKKPSDALEEAEESVDEVTTEV